MLTIILINATIGWITWSLSHYVIHRKWHKDILKKIIGIATHGETEHHRCYDQFHQSKKRDPLKAFISFPYPFILAQVALLSTWYGIFFGSLQGTSFFIAAFISMTIDDQAHRRWHSDKKSGAFMSYFKKLHEIHHSTHKNNFSFISGFMWDYIFNTFSKPTVTVVDSKPIQGNQTSSLQISRIRISK